MKKIKAISKKQILLIITILAIIIAIIIFENSNLQVTQHSFQNEKIPSEFDDFKICHISDLHNKEFGKKQSYLLGKIKENSPDIIVVTGDLIDRRKYNLDIAMEFILKAVEVAPVYYVSGNHEAWSGQYANIKEKLLLAGVTVLDNQSTTINMDGAIIDILGLSDPDFLTNSYIEGTNTSSLATQLLQWSENENFTILLSHRPELFSLYAENNIDLTFSGHAHGGQFRLPFIGGIVAPDQGVFPKYTSGFYMENHSTMFVSRGLGNSIIPIRINNPPQVAIITLHSK